MILSLSPRRGASGFSLEAGFNAASSTFSREGHLSEILQIDRLSFGDLPERDAGTLDTWRQLASLRNDTEICVRNGATGQIAGYLEIYPVTRQAAGLIRSGHFGDGELLPEHIVTQPDEPFALYVMTIAVLPEFKSHGLATRMWNAAVDYWRPQSPAETLVTVWGDPSLSFFRSLIAAEIGRDIWHHPICQLNLIHRLPVARTGFTPTEPPRAA